MHHCSPGLQSTPALAHRSNDTWICSLTQLLTVTTYISLNVSMMWPDFRNQHPSRQQVGRSTNDYVQFHTLRKI